MCCRHAGGGARATRAVSLVLDEALPSFARLARVLSEIERGHPSLYNLYETCLALAEELFFNFCGEMRTGE